MVIEDLGTGAAGAGVAHRPEIIAFVAFATGLVADAGDPFGGYFHLISPDLISLIVSLIDRHPQLICR